MPRPPGGPWGAWNTSHLAPPVRDSLTFAEVNAMKLAFQTGRFSKASLARIYDTSWDVVTRVIKGTYRYHREE